MKYTILAADDSMASLKLLENIFTYLTKDFLLLTANNGLEACKLALAHKPNLILMDLVMPKMNGVEAIKYLKAKTETKQIPIIILTSSESLEEAFKAGADDFIIKPFKDFELLIRIRLALSLVEKIDKIKHQNEKLYLQNIEIKQQREKLELQKKEILDDIRYSKRIQKAILPTKTYINSVFDKYFIFNWPKNIVSGDFYWVDKKNGKKIVAVADCTGHGISGAFLTMAGTAFLKEIINNYEFETAADILNHLRNMVIELLQQKGEEGETADGMDIALCVIETSKKQIQYAGANSPLYLITDNNLKEIKADRMPIGIHLNKKEPFTNHVINYLDDDAIYLFSDGYADQFGGPDNKKFIYKNLRQLFIDIQRESFQKQLEIVENTYKNWKGEEGQVDDVLVMGIKL